MNEKKIRCISKTSFVKDHLRKKSAFTKKPYCGFFEITFRCNLSCIHCYTKYNEKRKELSYKEICIVLEQLAELGVLFIVLTGGEVLMREDFFDIASYARKLHFVLKINTNATMLTPVRADKIARLYPDYVQSSIYGDRDTHDMITGVKGSFDKFIDGIKLLRERKVHVQLFCLPMKFNFDKIDFVRNLAEELGAEFTDESEEIFPKLDGSNSPYEICSLTDLQWKEYIRKKMLDKYTREGKIVFNRNSNPEKYTCYSYNNIGISPYGEIQTCQGCRMKNNSVRKTPLAQIFIEDPEIKKLRSIKLKDLKKCLECKYLKYCDVCPGFGYSAYGNFYQTLEQHCKKARLTQEVYQELLQEGKIQ